MLISMKFFWLVISRYKKTKNKKTKGLIGRRKELKDNFEILIILLFESTLLKYFIKDVKKSIILR